MKQRLGLVRGTVEHQQPSMGVAVGHGCGWASIRAAWVAVGVDLENVCAVLQAEVEGLSGDHADRLGLVDLHAAGHKDARAGRVQLGGHDGFIAEVKRRIRAAGLREEDLPELRGRGRHDDEKC